MAQITDAPAWSALAAHRDDLEAIHLRELFAADPGRYPRLSVEAAGMLLDYSKQRVTDRTVALLVELAVERGLPEAIAAMFAGERINTTEDRAAWHVALRGPAHAGYPAAVHEVLDAIEAFAAEVRGGRTTGFRGDAITDVVNIGIGGSDLGPRLVCAALAEAGAGPRAHFVANVDPDELDGVLARLRPETTLFVVTSKSFTTAETLANAEAARDWLRDAGASHADIARHFAAVTTNREAAAVFGVDERRMFGFWDWVGGRFSLWSAVGLPIALALGMDAFRALHAGAHAMDEHFRSAPLDRNLPALMGLLGVWNRNLLALPAQVVVPYAQRLAELPEWLQQLEMESNGKSVTSDGAAVAVETVAPVWGGVGTNAQHAFFQMLHQGTQPLPVDFVLPLRRDPESPRWHKLAANCLAQSEALMTGAEGPPERHFPGNRPSSTLVLRALDAHTLGALLAAYEHKVFVQGVLWGINSFDQFGVELGKRLARAIEAERTGEVAGSHDASTAGLIRRVLGDA